MNVNGFRDPSVEQEWARRCRGQVAFLRHKIPWLEHRESSDWDLAVRDLERVGKVTRELLGDPLVTVPREYVVQRYYLWGQIDFLPSFEWNGFVYLEGRRFWEGVREGGDGLPRPRVAHDALIAWLTGLLTGAFYHSRYDDLLAEGWRVDAPELQECLNLAFGEELGAEMAELLEKGTPGKACELVPDLRKSLKQRAFFGAPGETMEKVIRHWLRELYFHWKPPFPWVAFLGPDGIGKSTVIEGVRDGLRQSRLKTLLVHWRPKIAGREPTDAVQVTDPHARKSRGWAFSTLALVLLWARWMAGCVGRTWHQRAKEKVLISDRYYPDLLVDPRRYRYGGSLRVARFFFRFFPRPDLTIILHARPEVILARKQEVPPEELARQLDAYRGLAEVILGEVCLVDAGCEKEEVIDEVLHQLINRLF